MELMSQNVSEAASQHSDPKCVKDIGKGLQADLETRVAWSWLADRLLKPCDFGGVCQVRMQCGMRDGLQPAHYVGYESLHAQVKGRRRVLLLDPNQSFQGLYPFPCAHPYDGGSMVDFDRTNMDDWPLFSKVRGHVCILEPGEVLYLPMWWWRHIQELGDESIVLDFFLHQGERFRKPAMVPLPLGRYLEHLVAQTLSLRDVKHWLGIIAKAEEAEWVDLGTLKGHQLIQMVQKVRDEVENNLGLGKWQEFLHQLIDRRLEATPWLNVDFREPLYLKDRPVQEEDTRSQVEHKFPELFFNKLKDEGYNVERTPMSIFNPQHPEFIHKDNSNYQKRLQGKK